MDSYLICQLLSLFQLRKICGLKKGEIPSLLMSDSNDEH